MSRKILVTGGAGFIGSAVCRHIIKNTNDYVLNVDKLTYAGNLDSLSSISESERYQFAQVDICDFESMKQVFNRFKPNIIMHLAAESHVDRSIDGPEIFLQTNIIGTYNLLEASRTLVAENGHGDEFKFHHISTDEVYGDLGEQGLFTETTSYAPSSPYSASKASSDHLVRAWQRTYGLPTVITNCSNNYGPYHFPEKLIPLTILKALKGETIPIYGDGSQIRDWLYVEDHAKALYTVATSNKIGETYNIGGFNEKTNLEVVQSICNLLNGKITDKPKGIEDFSTLITFVQDRPGHDVRYAIDATKINRELGWAPIESFDTGLSKTVDWFLENEEWTHRVATGAYLKAESK